LTIQRSKQPVVWWWKPLRDPTLDLHPEPVEPATMRSNGKLSKLNQRTTLCHGHVIQETTGKEINRKHDIKLHERHQPALARVGQVESNPHPNFLIWKAFRT